jgi:hypothetical protein
MSAASNPFVPDPIIARGVALMGSGLGFAAPE